MVPRRPLLACAVLALTVLTGCADQNAPVREVASAYAQAWEGGDGAGVCRLLAPDTRNEIEDSTSKPCAEGVLEQDLPGLGESVSVESWSSQAQVRATGDTLFLSLFRDGWRVVAAGCRPAGAGPYDCTVAGG